MKLVNLPLWRAPKGAMEGLWEFGVEASFGGEEAGVLKRIDMAFIKNLSMSFNVRTLCKVSRALTDGTIVKPSIPTVRKGKEKKTNTKLSIFNSKWTRVGLGFFKSLFYIFKHIPGYFF